MKKGKSGLSTSNPSKTSQASDHGVGSVGPASTTAAKAFIPSVSSVETAPGKKTALQNDNIQTFDDDDNEWELGVGNLIIDLDADLERNAPSPVELAQKMSADMEHQATVDKGLKMKIKRKTLRTLDSSSSTNKHNTTVQRDNNKGASEKEAKLSNSDSKNKRAMLKKEKNKEKKDNASHNGFPHSSNSQTAKSDDPYEFNAKVEDRIRVPVKKTKVEKATTPPSSPTSKSSHAAEKQNETTTTTGTSGATAAPAADGAPSVRHACTETSDAGTCTEPEFLGPCEPGTSVMLGGIVWQETENGVLVVNVTWRGKTYVGTLLDATQHDWAPPRFNCESPTSSETPKGRGVKRNCRSGVGTPVENIIETRKLRKGRRGGVRSFQAPPSPAKSDITPMSSAKRKQRSAEMEGADDMKNKRCRSISRGTPTDTEPKPNSQGYIECPEANCSKKYKHMNGLKYHQSHAHSGNMDGDDSSGSRPATPVTPANDGPNNRMKDFEFGDGDEAATDADAEAEEPVEQAAAGETKPATSEANHFNTHVAITAIAPTTKEPSETEPAETQPAGKDDASEEAKPADGAEERQETKSPAPGNPEDFTENVHSPAYSDISDAAEAPSLGPENKSSEADSKRESASEPLPPAAGFNPFYYQKPYMMPAMAEKTPTKSPNTQVESSHRGEIRPDGNFHDEYAEQNKARIDTSVAQPLFSPGQQPHMSMLTAYGYMDPAFHHSPMDSERYREQQARLLEEQKNKGEGSKQTNGASSAPAPRPKDSENKPGSSNSTSSPAESSEQKQSEVRIKTEPHDSLLDRHQEDLRFYMYQKAKQHEPRNEEADRCYEEHMRSVLKIKQEPKSADHRPDRPHESQEKADSGLKPDLKRPGSPQEKSVIQEKRSKPSPATTPKSTKPPTPTLIPTYGQYAVSPSFLQGPYGQVPIDPHNPYRGVGSMPAPILGFPGSAAYMHPAALRYHVPQMDKDKQLMMSPGARHHGLHEPPKALDLLQQHASYYNTAQHHKIHELERAARPESSTPPKSRAGPSPLSVSVSTPKDMSHVPMGLLASPRHASPPPQRHVHTHHHTHLMSSYPIYDPYGAIINAGQGPSGLPPGAIGHPFPPK